VRSFLLGVLHACTNDLQTKVPLMAMCPPVVGCTFTH
jgi:hypothetical protein